MLSSRELKAIYIYIALRFSLENSQNLRDPRDIAPGVLL